MRIRLVTFAAAAALLGALPPARATGIGVCRDSSDAVISTTGEVGQLQGLYSLPADPPTQMVVFMHGYRNRSDSWAGHLIQATHHGALAVAMDYSGIGPAPDNRGWNVQEGADDSIAAAQHFLAKCGTIEHVFILGVSMGGNSSGLAVAAKATKVTDGSPLFDYWVDVEGVANVTEEYVLAKAAGDVLGSAYAEGAKVDMEAEMGGTPDHVPLSYADHTVVLRTKDIADSGIKGAVVVQGVDDGLVPYNQTREEAAALRALGVPTDVFTVLRRGSGESGTTLSGNVLGPLGAESGLAGHGWEGSDTQLVIKTGLERLWALMDGSSLPGSNPVGYREFVVDGELGTVPTP